MNSVLLHLKRTYLEITDAEKRLHEYDVVIQTTSIGMAPDIEETPLQVQQLKAGAVVSDIIYNPLETRFLKEAKQKGARIQNGLDMFVYQGALAFEKWTGIFPDTDFNEKHRFKTIRR